jgi:hypothetical protein
MLRYMMPGLMVHQLKMLKMRKKKPRTSEKNKGKNTNYLITL